MERYIRLKVETPGEQKEKFSLGREDLSGWEWLSLTLGHAPTEMVECILGLIIMNWGIWLMLPWWDASALTPTAYHLVRAVFRDEFLLGLCGWIVGVSTLISMFKDARLARCVCSVLMASFTGMLAVLFLFSDWRSPLFLSHGVYHAFAWWLMFRTREHYLHGKKRR